MGILLDHYIYRGIVSNKTSFEQIDLYNKAAKRIGLIPFYMSPRQVDAGKVQGLLYRNNEYRTAKRELPKVVYNRTYLDPPRYRSQMRILQKQCIVFNRHTKFDKLDMHRLLERQKSLKHYLPKTDKYSEINLKRAMNQYKGIYLKPANGGLGDGIMKLMKGEAGNWLIQSVNGTALRVSPFKAVAMARRHIGGKAYMIQEEIPLARYQGRPYDLRVTVQRNGKGSWQISGMIGKVAATGQLVTNMAKGGKAVPCRVLLQASGLDAKNTQHSIRGASLKIAKFLGTHIPRLADIGLDIGIDQKGRIYLIEVNGRDQRIMYQRGKQFQTLNRLYETPLRYAKYLFTHLKALSIKETHAAHF